MDLILNSLTHNLSGLFHFSGRDTRSQFWPYAIIVFALILAGFMSIMMPKMMAIMVQLAQGGSPAFPDFSFLRWWTIVMAAATVALLAAAVTRRMRDRGKSIGWALLPVALFVVLIPLVGDPLSMTQLPGWAFFALFLLNISYQASVIYLIVLLSGAGRMTDRTAA